MAIKKPTQKNLLKITEKTFTDGFNVFFLNTIDLNALSKSGFAQFVQRNSLGTQLKLCAP